jgi:hypothetical protein
MRPARTIGTGGAVRALALWIGIASVGALSWYSLLHREAAHERLMASVPLGSGLSRLGEARRSGIVTGGRVMRWLPSPKGSPDRSDIQLRVDGATIRTEFGMFRQKDLGDYDVWTQDPGLAAGFSGEVVLFTDSVQMGFVYIKGRLVKKEWGHLPG